MDVNDHLMLLGAAPLPPDLNQLDGAEIANRAIRERRESRLITGFVLVAALGAGIIGGVTPKGDESGTAMPFGPPVALTPLIALGRG